MELSEFRKKLINGDVDQNQRNLVIREFEYLDSITPKTILEKFYSHEDKDVNSKVTVVSGVVFAGIILTAVLTVFFNFEIFHILLVILMGLIPFAIIVFLVLLTVFYSKASPEYKNYDYKARIVEPALKLYDEKLTTGFHFDSSDLACEGMKYDDALVEAHLVKPFKKGSYSFVYSSCTYDWENRANKDAFEFAGYKVFYQWTDSDGDSHEDIYFDGTIYKFRTSFTIDGIINIMSTETKQSAFGRKKEINTFKKIKDKEYKVIDTESQAFSECFDTIATYDEEAYRYLTPQMIEALLNLRRNYFFSICLKGDVMTIAIDKKGFQNADKMVFIPNKPFFKSKNPTGDINKILDDYEKTLISIYDLKDILDPNGKYAA